MVTIHLKLAVVTADDLAKDAGTLQLRLRDHVAHACVQRIVRLAEGGLDLNRVAGAARDVVLWVVGIDDGDPVFVVVTDCAGGLVELVW
jgi:hypothetical protein